MVKMKALYYLFKKLEEKLLYKDINNLIKRQDFDKLLKYYFQNEIFNLYSALLANGC